MILGLPVQDPDPLVSGMGPAPGLGPDPDSLVRGTDPGIRIRTKMSWIPNTAVSSYKQYPKKIILYFFILKNKLALLKFKIDHFYITWLTLPHASKLQHKLMRVLSKQVCTSYFNLYFLL
jgi:hypothetical protein